MTMKMIRALIVIMAVASLAWAQSPETKSSRVPCQHRGGFFSVGFGLSYTSFNKDEAKTSHDDRGHWDSNLNQYVPDYLDVNGTRSHWHFGGLEAPSMDLRFGIGIGNMVVLHASLTGGIFRGELVREDESFKQHFVYDANRERVLETENVLGKAKTIEDDGWGYFCWFGLGFSIYPFRDPASPLNGLYVGFSSGLDIMGVRQSYHTMDGHSEIGGLLTRYEVGKDWWVSETWSVGVSLAFAYVSGFEDSYLESDGGNRKTISLLFRLTRG